MYRVVQHLSLFNFRTFLALPKEILYLFAVTSCLPHPLPTFILKPVFLFLDLSSGLYEWHILWSSVTSFHLTGVFEVHPCMMWCIMGMYVCIYLFILTFGYVH